MTRTHCYHEHFKRQVKRFEFSTIEDVSRYRDPQLQWVKITHICLIWDQTFANLDVHALI